LREAALCAATKQSSWIAAARFAHLAMTVVLKTRPSPAPTTAGGKPSKRKFLFPPITHPPLAIVSGFLQTPLSSADAIPPPRAAGS
jgi:hypothetical protein